MRDLFSKPVSICLLGLTLCTVPMAYAADNAQYLKQGSLLAATALPDANFPDSMRVQIKAQTGLDLEQWNNIMKMVNKPEQDNLRWQDFYGYCENIGDDRGYTIGIFGATTGGANDTYPDAPALLQQYGSLKNWGNLSAVQVLTKMGVKSSMSGKVLKIQSSAKIFCGKIRALNGDKEWQAAIWRRFLSSYVQEAVKQAHARNFHSPVVVGALVDTALNQGIEGRYGLQGVLAAINGKYSGEYDFLKKFSTERIKEVDKHEFNQPPNGTNRVKQWVKLWDLGQSNMKNADAAVVTATSWEMQ